MTTQAIYDLLGGQRAFGVPPPTLDHLRELLEGGLPFATLETIKESLALTRAEVLGVLAITDRTLVRRKKESRLQASESDRLFRLARVAALAVDVLEGEEKARRWLHKPNRALGGAVPLSLLSTDIGARQVEELLQRIDHGLFS
jgi:putative toxin-antitoxin system antitoxin component (TIGR02293 family)